MYYADEVGLPRIVAMLEEMSAQSTVVAPPVELLRRLAAVSALFCCAFAGAATPVLVIHGGAGVSQDTPLTMFFNQARSLRRACTEDDSPLE